MSSTWRATLSNGDEQCRVRSRYLDAVASLLPAKGQPTVQNDGPSQGAWGGIEQGPAGVIVGLLREDREQAREVCALIVTQRLSWVSVCTLLRVSRTSDSVFSAVIDTASMHPNAWRLASPVVVDDAP